MALVRVENGSVVRHRLDDNASSTSLVGWTLVVVAIVTATVTLALIFTLNLLTVVTLTVLAFLAAAALISTSLTYFRYPDVDGELVLQFDPDEVGPGKACSVRIMLWTRFELQFKGGWVKLRKFVDEGESGSKDTLREFELRFSEQSLDGILGESGQHNWQLEIELPADALDRPHIYDKVSWLLEVRVISPRATTQTETKIL